MSAITTDPFADPRLSADPGRLSAEHHATTTSRSPATSPSPSSSSTAEATLQISTSATLTLGTESLIVLDESLTTKRTASNFCGLLPQLSKATRAIPFHNILWAEVSEDGICIEYSQTYGRKASNCRVEKLSYALDSEDLHRRAQPWTSALLSRAYPAGVKRKPRVKVLVNPFGGQGYAQKLWEKEVRPIFSAARWEVDVERTTYRGHAVEIAQRLDLEYYDVVACASGDGLPHEVFNGLAKHAAGGKKALSKIAVVQIPCGSGNAMSLNLNGTDSPSLAAVEMVKAVKMELDLVAISQGERRFVSFLSQAVGIIAESDLGTESLRWMGSFRFTWGVLVRVLGKTIYPAEVSVVCTSSNKSEILESYRTAVGEHEAAQAKGHALPPTTTTDDRETDLPPLRYGTVQSPLHSDFLTTDLPNLGNFYAGNMCYMSPDTPFFLPSLPSDGHIDLVTVAGDIPRLTALKMLATVEDGRMMMMEEVEYRKIVAYRITPRMVGEVRKGRLMRWLGGGGGRREGLVAVDGERVGFEAFQAEVVSGLGRVLGRRRGVYEVGELGMR